MNTNYLESFFVALDTERRNSGKTYKGSLSQSMAQYRSAWNRTCAAVAPDCDIVTVDPAKINDYLSENPTINVHFVRPVLVHAIRNNIDDAFDNTTKEMIRWLL